MRCAHASAVQSAYAVELILYCDIGSICCGSSLPNEVPCDRFGMTNRQYLLQCLPAGGPCSMPPSLSGTIRFGRTMKNLWQFMAPKMAACPKNIFLLRTTTSLPWSWLWLPGGGLDDFHSRHYRLQQDWFGNHESLRQWLFDTKDLTWSSLRPFLELCGVQTEGWFSHIQKFTGLKMT